MKTKFFLALATAAMLAGCPGGGGGGTADERAEGTRDQAQGTDQGRDVAATDERRGYEDRTSTGERMGMGTSTDLAGNQRDFAEAYARAPWVHANVLAGDWEQADDDLQFISDQIADLEQNADVGAEVKQRIVGIKPVVAQLDGLIGAKDRKAIDSARQLVSRFAEVSSDQRIAGWIGTRQGGGAGTGLIDRDHPHDGGMKK